MGKNEGGGSPEESIYGKQRGRWMNGRMESKRWTCGPGPTALAERTRTLLFELN